MRRIDAGRDRALLHQRLCRLEQAMPRHDDAVVGGDQVLLGAIDDRPHAFLQRCVLHRNAFDAAVRVAALLRRAVDQIVVILVGERPERAGHVLHVNALAIFHRLNPVLSRLHADFLRAGAMNGKLFAINRYLDLGIINFHNQGSCQSGDVQNGRRPLLNLRQPGGLRQHQPSQRQGREKRCQQRLTTRRRIPEAVHGLLLFTFLADEVRFPRELVSLASAARARCATAGRS